ncbi:MAG TPA: hypothetical protein VGX50_11165 [Longimicrobium sp.]|nr:hypothetical protein [Longimicrobium sp.]
MEETKLPDDQPSADLPKPADTVDVGKLLVELMEQLLDTPLEAGDPGRRTAIGMITGGG